MANIKVKVDYAISDGTKLRFRTPCESTEVEGLVVTYPIQNGIGYAVKTFSFVDAHGTELSGVGNVFTSDVMIGVLLDVTKGRAYIKNADTNSYIEDIKYSMKKMDEERQEIFAEAGKSVVECKDATKNANAAAQTAKDAAAGVVTIEQNSQDELRFWVGTEEEYKEQKDTFSANTFCVIADDTTEEEILAAVDANTTGIENFIKELQFAHFDESEGTELVIDKAGGSVTPDPGGFVAFVAILPNGFPVCFNDVTEYEHQLGGYEASAIVGLKSYGIGFYYATDGIGFEFKDNHGNDVEFKKILGFTDAVHGDGSVG